MLPPDVLGLIVDLLSCEDSGLESVRTCSLVSKDFVHICRNYLFSTIKITHRRLTAGDAHQIPHPIVRFQELMENNPSLSSYIRTLELVSRVEYDCVDGFIALRHLKHVQTFRFGFCNTDAWEMGSCSRRQWSTIPAVAAQTLQSFIHQNPISSLVIFGIHQLPISFFHNFRVLEDLSVLEVVPEDTPIMPSVVTPSRLRRLRLQENTNLFAETFIVWAGIFEISKLVHLSIDFGELDHTNTFVRLLPLPKGLLSLDMALEKTFQDWTCRGNILSRLLPSSQQTLTDLKFEMRVERTKFFPPYGGLLHELEGISESNVLETLEIIVIIQMDSRADLNPTKWNQLDIVLSNGFSYLRKLHIHAECMVFNTSTPWEDAARIDDEMDALFGGELSVVEETSRIYWVGWSKSFIVV